MRSIPFEINLIGYKCGEAKLHTGGISILGEEDEVMKGLFVPAPFFSLSSA